MAHIGIELSTSVLLALSQSQCHLQCNPLLSARLLLGSDQAAQQLGPESSQGWSLHNLIGQPAPLPCLSSLASFSMYEP